MSADAPTHLPVMPDEVAALLEPRPGATIVDATVGLGGHARLLLERVGPDGRVIGLDRDPQALDLARRCLANAGPGTFTALHADHAELKRVLAEVGVTSVDGFLFDLGLSSLQLDDADRGFSLKADGPLDMRMDPTSGGRDAAAIVRESSETELVKILREFGEERRARAVARAIVRERERTPITTTGRLARLVEGVVRVPGPPPRVHPATRTFQALRIAVNGELVRLETTLRDAVDVLAPGGRVAVIAFHSLEDRIVKRTLRDLATGCVCPPEMPVCGCERKEIVRTITRRAVRPSAAEVDRNRRARSARLRVAEKLP